MPTTLDVIVDRVRSLCVDLGFQESVRLDRFDFDPAQVFGEVSVFRVDTVGQSPRGGTSYSEERTDLVAVTVGRAINADYEGTRRALLRTAHSLTSVIVRDGAVTSGSYTVPDVGAGSRIDPDPTSALLSLRLTLPINYDAQL